MDDAPHNTAISPKNGTETEWETSLSSAHLRKYALPIGLLGHSAIVINDEIHVFGGMWGKLSNFKGYGFHKRKQDDAIQSSKERHYDALYEKKYIQTWSNKYASADPSKRRASSYFRNG